jgi:hypothetical protein
MNTTISLLSAARAEALFGSNASVQLNVCRLTAPWGPADSLITASSVWDADAVCLHAGRPPPTLVVDT